MSLSRADLRVTAAIACGALAVHEIRWMIGYGAGAVGPSTDQGHGYLLAVLPVMVIVLALAVGQVIRGLDRPDRSRTTRRGHAWLVLSAALLSIYTGQELLEGAVSSTRPDGLTGVFGQFGWTAVPACVVVGALATFLLRFADELQASIVFSRLPAMRRLAPARARRPADFRPARLPVCASHLAGRGPPAP